MIFYTLMPDDFEREYIGHGVPLYRLGKVERGIVFWNDEALAFNRPYPQTIDDSPDNIFGQMRRIVETMVAECLSVPNMWGRIDVGSTEFCHSGLHFQDPVYYIGYPTSRPQPSHPEFDIGCDDEICVVCGGWLDENDYPVCSDCHQSYDHFCDYCDSGFYDEDGAYVSGYGWVCGDCLNNSGRFFYCDYHGEWEYGDDYHTTASGDCVCQRAIDNEEYVYCEECGELVAAYAAQYIDGEGWVCDDCLADRDGYAICQVCHRPYPETDLVDIDDKHVCPQCMGLKAVTCQSCGAVHLPGAYVYVETMAFCKDCYERLKAAGEIVWGPIHNEPHFSSSVNEYRRLDGSAEYMLAGDAYYEHLFGHKLGYLYDYEGCYTDMDNVVFLEHLVA